MTIIDQLSTATGVRGSEPNKRVAKQCIEEPRLLSDVAAHLSSNKKGIPADCAEVMTEVARETPELVAPYVHALVPLLDSKDGRARWEAMHAIEFIATSAPDTIERLLPKFEALIRHDKSVIVRDNATSAIANYASVGKSQASQAYPLLLMTLELWKEKQAVRVLQGLSAVAQHVPEKRQEIRHIAEECLTSSRTSARKEAARLLKSLT